MSAACARVAEAPAHHAQPATACRPAQADTRILEGLYRSHNRQAYLVAWGYLRDEEEALDAVQEAFVKAQRALHRFDGRCHPYGWFHRILVNVCIDRRRRKHRRPELICSTLDEGFVPAARTEPVAPRFELRGMLLQGLARLSDTHRDAIVMRELLGFSYAEIATSMKCRRGTVMSRLFRARQQLRAALEDELDRDSEHYLQTG